MASTKILEALRASQVQQQEVNDDGSLLANATQFAPESTCSQYRALTVALPVLLCQK